MLVSLSEVGVIVRISLGYCEGLSEFISQCIKYFSQGLVLSKFCACV
jgi:hypothetical protein